LVKFGTTTTDTLRPLVHICSHLTKYLMFLTELNRLQKHTCFELNLIYQSFSNFFQGGPLSLVRMFYGPHYSWDYQTH